MSAWRSHFLILWNNLYHITGHFTCTCAAIVATPVASVATTGVRSHSVTAILGAQVGAEWTLINVWRMRWDHSQAEVSACMWYLCMCDRCCCSCNQLGSCRNKIPQCCGNSGGTGGYQVHTHQCLENIFVHKYTAPCSLYTCACATTIAAPVPTSTAAGVRTPGVGTDLRTSICSCTAFVYVW